mmetsp:Transcript_14245/g.17303  ORF Transcript_14245/g.17303 Transcript_14245/m.17303 type:complete len:104 (-) Transcript_14245:1297-1608(-)
MHFTTNSMLTSSTQKLIIFITILIAMLMSWQGTSTKLKVSAAFSCSSSSFIKRHRLIHVSHRTITNKSPYRRTSIVMMPEGPEVRTLVDQLQPGVGLRLCDLQ